TNSEPTDQLIHSGSPHVTTNVTPNDLLCQELSRIVGDGFGLERRVDGPAVDDATELIPDMTRKATKPPIAPPAPSGEWFRALAAEMTCIISQVGRSARGPVEAK